MILKIFLQSLSSEKISKFLVHINEGLKKYISIIYKNIVISFFISIFAAYVSFLGLLPYFLEVSMILTSILVSAVMGTILAIIFAIIFKISKYIMNGRQTAFFTNSQIAENIINYSYKGGV